MHTRKDGSSLVMRNNSCEEGDYCDGVFATGRFAVSSVRMSPAPTAMVPPSRSGNSAGSVERICGETLRSMGPVDPRAKD